MGVGHDFSLLPRFPYNTRPCQVIRWSRGLIGLVSEARCWNQKSNLHQNYKRRSRATINESPTFSLSASHPHLPTQAPCTPALAHTSSLDTDLTRKTRASHFTLKTSPCLCRCLSCGGFAHDLHFKAHCCLRAASSSFDRGMIESRCTAASPEANELSLVELSNGC